MAYLGMSTGTSPVIAERTGAAITNGECKAAAFDANGKVVICATAGMVALGVTIMGTAASLASGGDIAVQIKDICRWKAGGSIDKGDLLATDASGLAVKATEGDFILAVALSDATSGQVVDAQIVKAGYVPVAATAAE